MNIKRTRSTGRDLVPINREKTEYGPKMKALPNDRYRDFVRALFHVKPGHGAQVRAAKQAGFGKPESTPETMAAIASRLANDERVQAAIREEADKHVRSAAPRALRALTGLIEDPTHRDHARGIAMVLDRTNPAEIVTTTRVEHDVTLSAAEVAQTLKRIAQLAAKFSVALPAPKIIEGEKA